MDISYRRTPPSLLERTFARLLKCRAMAVSDLVQLDLVCGDVLEIEEPATWHQLEL